VRYLSMLLFLTASVTLADWVAIGPDGGNVLTLAIDYSNPATLFAIPYEYPAALRLFRSDDQGTGWRAVGLIPQTSVADLIVDRHQSQILYALSQSSLVLRSTDAGVRWTSSTLPGYATALRSDPHQAGRLMASGYTASGYTQAAVFVSTDLGLSWTPRTLSLDTNYAYCLAFDPVNPGVAYAGCYRGKVYRTSDGGVNWESCSGGLPAEVAVTAMSVNSGDPAIIIAGASDGVYRTTDGGANWNRLNSIARTYCLEFSPCQVELGYLVGYDSTTRVFISTDAGATWLPQQSSVSLGKATSMIADPADGDGVFLHGGMGVMHSPDRGESWDLCNSGMRVAKISTISVAPWDRRRIYVEAADNGVFRSGDCGADWTRCEDFLSCGSICGIGLAPGVGHDVMWALEGLG